MSVVSLSWMPVKKDTEGSAGVQALQGMKDKLLATPGLLHAYHGKAIDPNEPSSIELVDIWSSEDAVKAARSNPDAAEAQKVFEQLIDTSKPDVKPHHNIFTVDTDFAPVADSPVIQQTFIFLPTTVVKADFDTAWAAAIKGFKDAPLDGWKAGAHGWGSEEIEHKEAGKSKVFLAISGWESHEKALAASEKAQGNFAGLEKFGQTFHIRYTTLSKVK